MPMFLVSLALLFTPESATYGTRRNYEAKHLHASFSKSHARCSYAATKQLVSEVRSDQTSASTYADMSSIGPSHCRMVMKRSIADFGRRSRRREGNKACETRAASVGASVSYKSACSAKNAVLGVACRHTLPGALRYPRAANGVNLTSTFNLAWEENGASRRAVWGP